MKLRIAIALLGAYLLLTGPGTIGAARAQSPGSSADPPPPCTLCVHPLGWNGWIEAGPGWVSDPDLKFADYRGLVEEGGFPHLAARGRYLDEQGRYLYLRIQDLALDSRFIGVRGGRQGSWLARFAYRRTPKYRGFGANSPFLGVGSGQLALPVDWRTAPTADALPDLTEAARPVRLELLRETLDAGFERRFASRWQWKADIQRIRKEGVRPMGAGALTLNTSHLPAPVDTTTDRLDLALVYGGERSSLSAGFSGSWFDNGATSLTWDNPFTPVDGARAFRAALAPDNRYTSLYLGGAFNGASGWRASGRVSVGRMVQDDPFLPYTINPDLPEQPLPRGSLDGRIDVATVDLAGRLSYRVSSRFNVGLRLKFRERDNETPVDLWTPVITDIQPRPPTPNRPYGFEDRSATLEARYRLRSGWYLRSGVERKKIERTLQAVRETTETRAWAELNLNRWSTWGLRFKFEEGRRHASEYAWPADPGLPENPLMRKFNLADRDRRRVTAEMSANPTDRLGLVLSGYVTDDSYRESPVGLRRSDVTSLNLDADFAAGSRLSIHAYLSLDRYEAEIRGRQGFLADWNSETTDEFLTVGFGLRHRFRSELTMNLEGFVSDAKGDILTRLGNSGQPFPTLTYELRNLVASLEKPVDQHWSWRLDVRHERYRSRDWQWDGLGTAGIPAVLSFGLDSPDYDVTVVRLLGRYRF